jgi:RNA 2',3'-cyclic 3'-phosphodiesterase
MPRLFVAIDLPEELKSAVAAFAHELPSAKWVSPEQLHLTLRFIGETDQLTFSAIKENLSRISFPCFTLSVCGVGHFPPGRRPRVIWLGLDPCTALSDLARQVETAVVEATLPPEDRPFSPHITLARMKECVPTAVERFEKANAGFTFPPFQVKEFILYSSLLTRSGAIHTKEAIFPCI